MADQTAPGPARAPSRRPRSGWTGNLPVVPLAIFAVFVILALGADVIVPHSPYATALSDRLLPPFWLAGGSTDHLLGTDRLGRDLLSRVILGARISMLTGVVSVLIAGAVGTLLGLVAGYFGGWLDSIIMRTTDAMLSFPIILVALVFAVSLGPGLGNLIIVLALAMWARFTRLARAETLTWKERDFVALARVAGCSSARILAVHIFPNVINALVVLATLQIGWVIVVEAALSFLGVGVPPPSPSWGSLIAEGRNYVGSAWWLGVFPGVALILLVLSINLIGDWLRDALDPRMRELR